MASAHAHWREAEARAQREADDADARERAALAEARRLRSDAYDARYPDHDRPPAMPIDNTAVVRPAPPVWVLEGRPRAPDPPQIHAPGGRVTRPLEPRPTRLSDRVARYEQEQAALRERRARAFEREAATYEHAAAAYAAAAADARSRRDEARGHAECALEQHGAVAGYEPIEGFDEELQRHATP